MISKIDVTSNARWTYDCQGKQDLDFRMVCCDTRYYPDYSAFCNIRFMDNFCEEFKSSDESDNPYVESDIEPITLAKSDLLYGNSEVDIKQKVKDWYNSNMIEAMEKALSILKNGLM